MKYINKSTLSQIVNFYLFVCFLLIVLLFFLPHSSFRKGIFAMTVFFLCLSLAFTIIFNRYRIILIKIFLATCLLSGLTIFFFIKFHMLFPLKDIKGIIGYAQYIGYPSTPDNILIIFLCMMPIVCTYLMAKKHDL